MGGLGFDQFANERRTKLLLREIIRRRLDVGAFAGDSIQ
jgi:hypothetical protein